MRRELTQKEKAAIVTLIQIAKSMDTEIIENAIEHAWLEAPQRNRKHTGTKWLLDFMNKVVGIVEQENKSGNTERMAKVAAIEARNHANANA